MKIAHRHIGRGQVWRKDQRGMAICAQHLGQFPTIVFCSDDLRLVRGSPSNRRRWLDAAIGGTVTASAILRQTERQRRGLFAARQHAGADHQRPRRGG